MMSDIEIQIQSTHVDPAVQRTISELLAAAFLDDNLMIGQLGATKWRQIAYDYFYAQLNIQNVFLLAYKQDRLVGCMTANSPHYHAPSAVSIATAGQMLWLLGRHYFSSQAIATRIAAELPVSPHYYLNQIAVSPRFQNQKIGRKMLEHLVKSLPKTDIYVDCEPTTSRFYLSSGFARVSSIENPSLDILALSL